MDNKEVLSCYMRGNELAFNRVSKIYQVFELTKEKSLLNHLIFELKALGIQMETLSKIILMEDEGSEAFELGQADNLRREYLYKEIFGERE